LVDAACAEQKSIMITKDISWLWRTAYNSAIQGCSEWNSAEAQVTELFQISREVIFLTMAATWRNSLQISLLQFTATCCWSKLKSTCICMPSMRPSPQLRAEVRHEVTFCLTALNLDIQKSIRRPPAPSQRIIRGEKISVIA
jgi:hypothetical protein